MNHRIKKSIKTYNDMVFYDGMSLIKKSGLNMILFELIYKLGFAAVFYPVFLFLLKFTLRKSGFLYLTNNYLFSYLKSPYTIISMVLILALLMIYVTYEVCCLSVCYDAAYHGTPIALTRIFAGGLHLMKITIKKKKIRSVVNIAVISLMMNITLLGYFLYSVKINSTVKDVIRGSKPVIITIAVIVLFLFIYSFIHVFTTNYLAYDAEDITDGKRQSRILFKNHFFKCLMVIIGWNLLIFLVIGLIYILLAIIIIAGVLILDRANMGMAIYLSVFRVAITVIKIVLPVISVPISFAVFTGLFYRLRNDKGNKLYIGEIAEDITEKRIRHPLAQKVIAIIFSAILFTVNIFYMVKAFDNNPFNNVEMFSDTLTMAHRGSSYEAPENTMLAFENAVKATADYIELDVHETKDGVIVVIHDDNLKRTTGVNKKVYNMTYDEIKDLDAGSYFGDEEEFKKCRIPTLEEVMSYTKGKIKLNIEIKLSAYEPDLVEGVAALIEKYDYKDECYVTSMNYKALTEIKKINEEIKTGYILYSAYGNYYNIDNVDAFSINFSYINKNVVDAIHYRGKQLFVWTINDRKTAEKMVAMGVDAVITDNPVMGKEATYARYSYSLIENVLSYVFED